MSNYVAFGTIKLSDGEIHVGVLAPAGQVRIEATHYLRGKDIGLSSDEAAALAGVIEHAAIAAPTIHGAYEEYRAAANRAAEQFGDTVKDIQRA
ncbi:MAG: hypothetical protein ACRDTI_10490 [Mycobacterium sp.]